MCVSVSVSVLQCMIFKHIRVMCQAVMVTYLHVNMTSMHHVTIVTCDNSHMTVLQEGFRFVRFLFVVLVIKSLSVYTHDRTLYYVLSDSQF